MRVVTCDCGAVAKYHTSHHYMSCGSKQCKEILRKKSYAKNCRKRYGVNHYQKTEKARRNISEKNYTKSTKFIEKYTNRFKDNLNDDYLLLKFSDPLFLKHKVCDNEFHISRNLFYSRRMRNLEICTICNKLGGSNTSKGENEIFNYICTLFNGSIIKNTRKIIPPYELDIFLPDIKLAIEFNGNYDHANPSMYKKYDKIRGKTAEEIWQKDKRKENMCVNNDIKLIVVWQDEWESNCDIVKETIRLYISAIDNMNRRKQNITVSKIYK